MNPATHHLLADFLEKSQPKYVIRFPPSRFQPSHLKGTCLNRHQSGCHVLIYSFILVIVIIGIEKFYTVVCSRSIPNIALNVVQYVTYPIKDSVESSKPSPVCIAL